MWTLLMILPSALAADSGCLPAATWISRAHEDIVAGDFDAGRAALAQAEASMDCEVVAPQDLGRYWLHNGALLALTGDEPAARHAFAASRRVLPDGWDPTFGDHLHQLYVDAADGTPVALTVDTNREQITLDGTRVRDWPQTVPGGPHLVQVLQNGDDGVYGHRFFDIQGPGEVQLETGFPEVPRHLAGAHPRAHVPWLVAAASGVVLSGASAGVALWQRGASGNADSIASVQKHEDVQIGAAWTSVGLLGAGVVCGGVGAAVFVW